MIRKGNDILMKSQHPAGTMAVCLGKLARVNVYLHMQFLEHILDQAFFA